MSRGLCHAVSRSQYVSRSDGHTREVRGLLSSHPAHTGAGAGAERGSVDQSDASMKCIDQSEARDGGHLPSLAWSRETGRQHLPAARHSSQALRENKRLVFLNKSFFFLDMDRLLKDLGLINFLILEADIVILLIPLLSPSQPSSSLLGSLTGCSLQWPPARHCTMDNRQARMKLVS